MLPAPAGTAPGQEGRSAEHPPASPHPRSGFQQEKIPGPAAASSSRAAQQSRAQHSWRAAPRLGVIGVPEPCPTQPGWAGTGDSPFLRVQRARNQPWVTAGTRGWAEQSSGERTAREFSAIQLHTEPAGSTAHTPRGTDGETEARRVSGPVLSRDEHPLPCPGWDCPCRGALTLPSPAPRPGPVPGPVPGRWGMLLLT